MWIRSLSQIGMRKLFILGLASSLAACGGGGGGGEKPAPSTPSSIASSSISSINNSLSSSISSPMGTASSIINSSTNSSNNSLGNSNSSQSSTHNSSASTTSSVSSSTSSVIVAPIDTIPDAFGFSAVTGVALSANVTSPAITISGIDVAVPISISGGQYSINGGAFTNAVGAITNGQTVVVSLTALDSYGSESHAVLTIGGVSQTFTVTTELTDTTPDAFSFTAVTGAALNANVTSTAITISGIDTSAPISITGGQYSIDGGAATSSAGTIENGQAVVVSLAASDTPNTEAQAVLTIGGVSQAFSVTTVPADTTPDAFNFTAVTDSELNATVASSEITISGINTAAPISITGGQYSINGGAATNVAGTISNGQTVVVLLTASAAPSTTTHAVLKVGGVSQIFSATTVPADTIPNAFSFAAVTGAALSATVTSTAITISGINTSTPIRITGGRYSIDGGAATSVASSVTNGQSVIVSVAASATPNTVTQAVLTVGGVSQTFSVTTVPADTTPDAFSFAAVTGAGVSATVTSSEITISGINTVVPISITGGRYSINGKAATSAAGTISNGQSVVVSIATSGVPNTETQAVLTVGDVSQTFSVTTELEDATPDLFHFIHAFTASLNTAITSDLISITGVNVGLPISVTNGEYSIDGGTFTSADGTVRNGQTVAVKIISASGIGSTVQSDITIGGIANTFSVTTVSPQLGGSIQGTPLNLAGVVTTLAGTPPRVDGVGAAVRFASPYGSVSEGDYLYIADTSNNTIRQIEKATGIVTTFSGSNEAGSVDGTRAAVRFNQPRGITSDGDYLYVTDANNKIRKIELATGVVSTIAGGSSSTGVDGIGTEANFSSPHGITVLGDYLYVADTYNHKIRKVEIATGVVTTLAGYVGNSATRGDIDGAGADARFNNPSGIATDGTYLYVADTYNNKIRKIEIATGIVTTFAGSGEENNNDTDGIGVAATIYYPTGITRDGAYLYVTSANRIRKIEIATGLVTTFAGSGSLGEVDGIGSTASFRDLSGISSDGTYLYISDRGNQKVRRVEIATTIVSSLAGNSIDMDANGVGAAANFRSPSGVTTDGTYLYIADSGNYQIRKVEIATGTVSTVAGIGLSGSKDGTGRAAWLSLGGGITTDGTYLYVADTNTNKIRKVDIATGVVTTLAGNGSYGSTDGAGAAASFYSPSGITTDGNYLYVVDRGNNKIRKIEIATGVVVTLVDSGISYPSGIATDGTYLYVADFHNQRIRKILIETGVVSTLAGGQYQGDVDGVGISARFKYPHSIATDGTYLYVTDANHKIRKIEIATGVVTTVVGSTSAGSADGVGAAGQFHYPYGITTDGFALYVTDSANNTIRKIE